MYYLQHKIHLICHLYLNIQLLCNKFHSNCVKKGLTFLNYVCTKYHIEFNKWYYCIPIYSFFQIYLHIRTSTCIILELDNIENAES